MRIKQPLILGIKSSLRRACRLPRCRPAPAFGEQGGIYLGLAQGVAKLGTMP